MTLSNGSSFAPMNFSDAEKKAVDVTIGEHQYELRQATVNAATNYRNAISNSFEMKNGQPVRVRNVANAQPILLLGCLFQKANGKPCTREFIYALRDDIHTKLVRRAKEISGIQDETDLDKDRLLDAGHRVDQMMSAIEDLGTESKSEALTEVFDMVADLANMLMKSDEEFAKYQSEKLKEEVKNS